jgi:predicted transcriptional regulator
VPSNAFASREHRQVFALVDGQRTIEEIAHLLHRPSDVIVGVLQELRAAGFIV